MTNGNEIPGRIVPLRGSIRICVGAGMLLKAMYPKAPILQKILIKLYLTLESINNRMIKK